MEIYDVVVIGGGPAGMMAAGRAAELGGKVLLIHWRWSLQCHQCRVRQPRTTLQV